MYVLVKVPFLLYTYYYIYLDYNILILLFIVITCNEISNDNKHCFEPFLQLNSKLRELWSK